jgi:pimeloyl-ACP methyl ester carboxylesterase
MTALALFSGVAMAAEPIRITPAFGPAHADATLQWVTPSDTAWQTAAPTFDIHATDKSGLEVVGRLAGTPEDLLIRVDVTDQVHINNQDGGNIWNGDFVRVSIDGRGDGPLGAAPETPGLFGPDDMSIGVALTPKGPQGWTFSTAVPALAGAYPKDLINITRDETKKLTHYEIRVPWARLATKPGTFPTFGIGIGTRSVDSQNGPVTQLDWGGGVSSVSPGLYKRVNIGKVPTDATAIVPLKTEIWDSQDQAQVYVAVSATKPTVLRLSDGTHEQTESIAASDGITRRLVEYTPPASAGAAPTLRVSIEPEGGKAVQQEIPLVLAEPIVQATVNRLRELAATSPHPLFTRHLHSLEAIIWTEWGRAALYNHENQASARQTLGFITALQKGFKGDSPATKWESYYRDGLPLLLAFDSGRDHTTQYYTMTLPKGWDPAKDRAAQAVYPLFVELHGAGDPHALNGPASYYGNVKYGGLGYESPGTYEMHDRVGYHIMPFGRGNSGYRDIGETDVWEAMGDLQKNFRTDPDRTYLYGFSMGGGGTFNIGRETPDRWAAIAILGMGARPTPWQAKNLSMVPVYIWGGEVDPIVFGNSVPKEVIQRFAQLVSAAGGEVKAWSSPGIGHNYLGEVQKDSVEWLKTHTRKRPDKFTFTVDDERHPGVWGISIRRDDAAAGLPSFDCTIDKQTVSITTHATTGARIILGDQGLNMAGEVTLVVDGKQAFQGPVSNEPITVGGLGSGGRGR